MGKGSQQVATQTQIQDVPGWAKPFYEDLLAKSSSFSEEPYVPYGGQRLVGDTPDLALSQEMLRGVAGQPIPGFNYAAGTMGGLGSLAGGLGQQMPGQFSAAPFQQTGVSPYAGFQAGQVSPFSGFQAGRFQETAVSPFAGFERSQVSPYAGFDPTLGEEFTAFREGQATPFAGFDQFGGAEKFAFDPARQFGGDELARYMDPYMQTVVGRQQEDAIEQFRRQQAARDAQAVGAGAFGGSRQAVQQGIAEEALSRQLGDIQAIGSQRAFEQAQQQFERDRAASMTAEQRRAEEAARVQGIGLGEAARVQQARAAELARVQGISVEEAARVQGATAAERARIQSMSAEEFARVQQSQAAELARVQGISVEEAARVQQAQAAELARTQGIGVDEAARVQAANIGEQSRVQQARAAELARVQGISVEEAARIQSAQAAELARTQGIGVDEAARVQAARAGEEARVQQARADDLMRQREFQLQTMGFSADMAREVAALGERARAGDIQAAQLLEAQGLGQMARDQAGLDIAYEDFLRQQGFPQEQIAFQSSILRGLPIGDAGTATTMQPYNPLQQALGAGISALGLYRGLT